MKHVGHYTPKMFILLCPENQNLMLRMDNEHTQTIIDETQKETAIDQQQHSCEMLLCQSHQTILRCLPTAATASMRWRVRELYCQTSYLKLLNKSVHKN
jgi:hypothetical protein